MFFFNNFVTAHFVVCLAELLTFSLELPVFLVVGVGVLHRLLMLERLTLHLGVGMEFAGCKLLQADKEKAVRLNNNNLYITGTFRVKLLIKYNFLIIPDKEKKKTNIYEFYRTLKISLRFMVYG